MEKGEAGITRRLMEAYSSRLRQVQACIHRAIEVLVIFQQATMLLAIRHPVEDPECRTSEEGLGFRTLRLKIANIQEQDRLDLARPVPLVYHQVEKEIRR